MQLRTKIWHSLQRQRSPHDVSIISDDCWGGQYYRILGIPYLTPTVGCWIEPGGYLGLVRKILSGDPIMPLVIPHSKEYPLLGVDSARLHFIHDHDPGKTLDTFGRRMQRLQRDRLFVKADFGKYYTPLEVARWNELALPNSVALYPRGTPLASGVDIHHGVAIDAWNIDGAKMYEISQRHFDVVRWLKTGTPGKTAVYSFLQRFLLPALPASLPSPEPPSAR